MPYILLDPRDDTTVEFALAECPTLNFPIALRFNTGRSRNTILITREHLQKIHLQVLSVLKSLPEPEVKEF